MFQIQTLQPTYLATPFHHHRLRNPAAFRPSPTSCTTVTVPFSATNKNRSIQSLCQKGQLKQAIHLLSHEQNPTQHTYELLIQSCAHQSLSDAFSVHRNLTDNGFDQDPFLATKLINMYTELDSIAHARQVFDEIRQRTIYVWNAIFRALSLSGHGEEVLSLYTRMNRIGMLSDRFTYTYALKACVVSESKLSSPWRGKEIHAHILRHGYESHVHIMTTLVDIEESGFWSAMIACFAKNGRPFEALDLFHEMMLESGDMLPNSVTMVSVLQACAACLHWNRGS
ncbi:hypothetical protein Pfo_028133 [Paulownia fortunei]|nr:hypothetical protein Pfo_028133 [Paulownia fortunei]